MAVNELERLLTRNVPHILEKILLSVDYNTYKICQEVSKSWKNVLMSESFRRRGNTVFCEDIRKEINHAARAGKVDAINKLLSSFEVDVNFTSGDPPVSPLTEAACGRNGDVVQLLLESGADPNFIATHRKGPHLFDAAGRGDKQIAQLLLDGGADPNLVPFHGCTALHVAIISMQKHQFSSAAYKRHEEVVKLLLERGSEPNLATMGDFCLELYAAEPGQPNIQVHVHGGSTSLHLAAKEGHKQTVLRLLDRGAKLNLRENNGRTPFHWAAERGHKDVVQVLLNTGADVNVVTPQGFTPLHYAACRGHKDVVLLLLDRGADQNLLNMYWDTPLDLAVLKGHEDVIQILQHIGVQPNKGALG